MQEELKEIVNMLNNFSHKYKCEVEIETFEGKYIDNEDTYYFYKAKAIKPKETIASSIGGNK